MAHRSYLLAHPALSPLGNLDGMPTTRNAQAGQPETGQPTTTQPSAGIYADMCSQLTDETLPGTAKPGKIILALEYVSNWGHDILDGTALGEELTKKIESFLDENGAQLQFIRRPGREGQQRAANPTRQLYISWAEGYGDDPTPILESLQVSGPEDLLNLDLSAPGAAGGQRIDGPLLLVCTHGKRDKCCAVFGRPVADELTARYGQLVWESSHTKGHRFAPSMILLPYNYSYGQLGTAGASSMLERTKQGELWLEGCRGRGIWDPVGQAAELAVAEKLASEGHPVKLASMHVAKPETTEAANPTGANTEVRIVTVAGEYSATTSPDTDPTGAEKEFTVRLTAHPGGTSVPSCGKGPKQTVTWVAEF